MSRKESQDVERAGPDGNRGQSAKLAYPEQPAVASIEAKSLDRNTSSATGTSIRPSGLVRRRWCQPSIVGDESRKTPESRVSRY